METQPAWSPDGKYLYFVSCPIVPKKEFLNVKYDLQRIGFDAEHGTWSDVETLVSAKETGLGCTFPTLSPDNKFLLFCMTDRGSFSIVRQSTDLYIMDLEKKSFKKLDINSDHSDSYHGWSSNGRWIIFTSKRTDGIFGKFFISYVDSSGNVHKPLLLPQHNPRFYDTFTKSFQRAEFTTAPFKENPAYLNDIIGDTGRVIIASYR
jgi:dipeptidyl aminopeptidase/acylaminoacyl peptidase